MHFNCCRILYIHDVTSILFDLHVESQLAHLVMSTKGNKTRYIDTSSYLITNTNQIFRIWWTIKITPKNCIRKSDQAKSQHSGIAYAFPSQIRSPALDLYLMCLFFCVSLFFSILLILCLVGLCVPILLKTYLSK